MLRRTVGVVAGTALIATSVSGCTADTIQSAPSQSSATTTATSTSSTSSTSTSTTLPASTSTSTTTSTTTIASTTSTSTSTSTTSTSTTSTSTTSNLTPGSVPGTAVRDPQSPIWQVRPPSDIPPPPLPPDWTVETIGTSIAGRPITALRRSSPAPRRTVLVVGGVHGNEPASPPIVRSLVEVAVPDDFDVWLVPEMNPDGVAAGTRDNASHVDLNRNFPWGWRPDDGGPYPLSEPETRAVADLIDRLRPDAVVWVHQPLGYVSSIGATPDELEQAWSRGAAIPVRPDVTQHGGGESWAALDIGLDSLLVEVDGWDATPGVVAAHRAGYAALVVALP